MARFEIKPARWTEEDERRAAAEFPGSCYGNINNLNKDHFRDFQMALEDGNEESIHRAIEANPYLLQYVIPESGHHGTWAYPKRTIRTSSVDGRPGLIPDFLVANRNSLGLYWWIVELKRPDVQFSNARGDGYSTDGHKAIAQCAGYYAHFLNYIETVRSNTGLTHLASPKGIILVIGNSQTETEAQQRCRAEFEGLGDKVRVATYDRILQGATRDRKDWFV
ncbi:Shedu anti-phage system protein SduA domain-containing protein [Asticcacaulis benevestitus]|uniref:Shedu protein SduA C-terminal domain-containing protein n=1 Tax=Asticcacaulis benevestitus DSM 16100 = ATCC BAA-896 TaxID=1121022 RepID=V4P7M3_9CAUL|nr:Shedu anti-phage system protein SduA domain-containing protein [Asticcacaulis benevestitus]ESQ89952.1 hypothetical protein ABENE_13180 [Asticcacaulis benevestitus DSM 16100 = ATCC BAA-896]